MPSAPQLLLIVLSEGMFDLQVQRPCNVKVGVGTELGCWPVSAAAAVRTAVRAVPGGVDLSPLQLLHVLATIRAVPGGVIIGLTD